MTTPDWCGPPIFHGQWTELTGAEALTMAHEIGVSVSENPSLVQDARIERTRVRALPCYPGAILIEAQAQFGERRGLSNHIYGSWGMVTLDGASAVLHDLNAIPGALVLETEEQVAAYHLLFCNVVRGEEGRFRLVGPHEPAEWTDGPKPDDAVFATMSSPILISRKPDHWAAEAALLYGTSLFYAHFEIGTNGMIEMMDDRPIASDPPLRRESWSAQFRIPAPEAKA
ncbi:hypothetical protein P1X14_14605 [Sphingomonas sp. AOB5]|uniref:hypothetical protein n=1 Tax=Sphingomonas sp. AOB5 TaxID=3034017 RepID=UPI0023F9971B|nr:hypothetical protein [Sphingomonas sp. AOB5]MDF7776483.1 hypothetical protein [Sphingomonas sp. AOB5]